MKKYTGPTKSFRFKNPKGSPDEYRWVTLKNGDVVPADIQPFLQKERDKEEVRGKVQDFVDDLADDGKRNFSNDPEKDSPGRPKKKVSKKGSPPKKGV